MSEVESVDENLLNFDAICRFCMKFSLFLKPLFNDNNEPDDFASTDSNCETVAEMVILCTQLQISLDDKLPKFMCNTCMDELLRSHKFRKQCLKSDEKLREIIQKNIPKPCSEENDDIKSLDDIYDVDKIYDLKDYELNEIHTRSSKLFLFNPTQPELMTSRNDDYYDEISQDYEEEHVDYSQEGCNDENSSFRKYLNRKTSNDTIVSVKALHKQKCPECKKVCSNSKCLKNHVSAHEKERQKLSDPGLKNEETKEKQSSSTQFSQSNGEITQAEICHNNYRRTISDVNKQNHLHLRFKAYRCDQCSKYFRSHKILQNHRRVHVREKEVFKCWKCNAMFLLPTSYRRHMKSHSSSDEKYDEETSATTSQDTSMN